MLRQTQVNPLPSYCPLKLERPPRQQGMASNPNPGKITKGRCTVGDSVHSPSKPEVKVLSPLPKSSESGSPHVPG